MKELLNLLKIKSLVTIIMTIVFAILCLKGKISEQNIMNVVITIIAFYYGTQKVKE